MEKSIDESFNKIRDKKGKNFHFMFVTNLHVCDPYNKFVACIKIQKISEQKAKTMKRISGGSRICLSTHGELS